MATGHPFSGLGSTFVAYHVAASPSFAYLYRVKFSDVCPPEIVFFGVKLAWENDMA